MKRDGDWYATTFARRDNPEITHEVADIGTAHVDEAAYHARHILAVEMKYDSLEGVRTMLADWQWLYTERVRPDGQRSREAVSDAAFLCPDHPDHPNNAGLGLSYATAERVEQLQALGRYEDAQRLREWMV